MFAKLLKYDMKRTMRVGLPLIIAALIIIFVGFSSGLFYCFTNDLMYADFWSESDSSIDSDFDSSEDEEDSFGEKILMVFAIIFGVTLTLIMLLSNLLSSLCSIGLPILTTVMFIIVLVNFYSSLITDEGYLTFTLPVKTGSLLFSKFLNGAFWNLTLTAICLVGVIIIRAPGFIYSLAPTLKHIEISDIKVLFDVLGMMFNFNEGINPISFVIFIILAFLLAIITILAQQSFYFFTIFLGGVVAKKHKLLAGAGFSVLGYVIYYLIEQLLAWVVMICCFTPLIFVKDLGGVLTTNLVFLIINLILAFSIVILVVAGIGFFLITNLLAKRKLNLP